MTHLRLALGDVPELAGLARNAAREEGRILAEMPHLWRLSHRELVALVRKVDGLDVVESAKAAGKGVIFLTPHLGSFEVAGHFCASLLPTTALFRPPRQDWLAPLMWEGRVKDNLHQAPADVSGVRLLLKALKRKEAVFMLPDQAPSAGEGRWLPFFGRPAYTMTLAARLTETGAAPIFMFARRLPGGRGYEVLLRSPAQPITGSTEERAARINEGMESLIRGCPSQYLWSYNRYKRPAGAEPPPAANGLAGEGGH